MKLSFYIILVLSVLQLSAQKTINQTIDNPEVKTIFISDDNVFKINIKTTSDHTIKLRSRIEGEYTKDIIVSTEAKNDTLFISSSFQPFYKEYNDKLSAHKVLSVEIDVWVPKQFSFYAKSAMASANIEGDYKSLTLELPQGNTVISNFRGNATVNSINGNIIIETNYATVKAHSKTGIVNKEELVLGKNQIAINTINGNISVIKTKK